MSACAATKHATSSRPTAQKKFIWAVDEVADVTLDGVELFALVYLRREGGVEVEGSISHGPKDTSRSRRGLLAIRGAMWG